MDSKKEIQHVYLVGAKSLGAYGGYETFVYKLTEYHQNKENIKYHVACKANGDGCMDESKFEGVTKINEHEFEFHNAHCFKIDVPQIGPAQAIYYDVAALKACCEHIKKNHIPHPIVYIMACRIGPFAGHFYKEIHKLGGTVYLNPDGHEWMRAKWSAPIRKYWKISEQMMVKYCDLAICDSVNRPQIREASLITDKFGLKKGSCQCHEPSCLIPICTKNSPSPCGNGEHKSYIIFSVYLTECTSQLNRWFSGGLLLTQTQPYIIPV